MYLEYKFRGGIIYLTTTRVPYFAHRQTNVAMVYLALPEGSGFMMGPLDKPAKERKAAQRREKHTVSYNCTAVDDAVWLGCFVLCVSRKGGRERLLWCLCLYSEQNSYYYTTSFTVFVFCTGVLHKLQIKGGA